MMQPVRAAQRMLRLRSARPQVYLKPSFDRVERAYSRWAAKRRFATGGGGRDRVDASAVGARRDELMPRLPWDPLGLGPLPLRVPIPVEMSLPLQQATNADGYVFAVQANIKCTCELYKPASGADVRDAVLSAAHQAVREEMLHGGWRYHCSNSAWEKDAYAQRVAARMGSSIISSSMRLDFNNYCITDIQFDPLATLAAAATGLQDPAKAPVFASVIEIIRLVNKDGFSLEGLQGKVEVATKGATIVFNLCATTQPAPPPQGHRWILGLFCVALAVAVLYPAYIVCYAIARPDKWTADKDAAIEAYANSFKYHSTWGICGETLSQRKERLMAERQRQQQEEERKKMEEHEKLRMEEERMKQLEEWQALQRFEASLTPWQRTRYRLSVSDHRFQRYRRP